MTTNDGRRRLAIQKKAPVKMQQHGPRSCQTLREAKAGAAITKVCTHIYRWLRWFALLTAAAGSLASCDTPVGVAPALRGTYWEHALVTNPDGGGPQVVRWGPPQNYVPRADQ